MKGRYVSSDAAAIGGVIEQFMKDIDYIPSDVSVVITDTKPEKISDKVDLCPKCHSSNLKNESGCAACLDCGHSKCG